MQRVGGGGCSGWVGGVQWVSAVGAVGGLTCCLLLVVVAVVFCYWLFVSVGFSRVGCCVLLLPVVCFLLFVTSWLFTGSRGFWWPAPWRVAAHGPAAHHHGAQLGVPSGGGGLAISPRLLLGRKGARANRRFSSLLWCMLLGC